MLRALWQLLEFSKLGGFYLSPSVRKFQHTFSSMYHLGPNQNGEESPENLQQDANPLGNEVGDTVWTLDWRRYMIVSELASQPWWRCRQPMMLPRQLTPAVNSEYIGSFCRY
jgi:hypothetical protein